MSLVGWVLLIAPRSCIFLPYSGLSCSVASLHTRRVDHTVESTGLLCGGYTQMDTCLQWRPDSGTWEEVLTLDVERTGHVSWTPGTGIGTYLMGGYDSKRTTTLIKPDGTQEPGFTPKDYVR